MIELGRSRERMLESIGVRDAGGLERLTDPADPRFLALPELRLELRGETPGELLPRLNAAFAARFRHVPSDALDRDLLRVLKKGLGNAHKWGNRKQPGRQIAVDAVVSGAGAVVAISDEGQGFDVERVLGGLARGEQVFQHGGSGFLIFQRAHSCVSFESGGRTLVVHFLCVATGGGEAAPDGAALARATDAEHVRALIAGLPRFAGARLRSCRAELASKPREGRPPLLRYALGYEMDGGDIRTAVLAGSVLRPGEPAKHLARARALFAAADAPGRVRIPEPLGAFEDPPLVLFGFDPRGDLEDQLERLSDPREAVEIAAAVGERLRALHGSGVALDAAEPGQPGAALRAAAAAAEETLAGSPERGRRAAVLFSSLEGRMAALAPCAPVPVHGALTWGAILAGEGALYLHGLGDARCAHPGLDVGGFLADLRRFHAGMRASDPQADRVAREAFLTACFEGDRPAWLADLPAFEAAALALRAERLLRRPRSKWERKIDPLLALCEAALEA